VQNSSQAFFRAMCNWIWFRIKEILNVLKRIRYHNIEKFIQICVFIPGYLSRNAQVWGRSDGNERFQFSIPAESRP
jgi:hypothetical protein